MELCWNDGRRMEQGLSPHSTPDAGLKNSFRARADSPPRRKSAPSRVFSKSPVATRRCFRLLLFRKRRGTRSR